MTKNEESFSDILRAKLDWYIQAHSHSSLGGLNILKLFFELNYEDKIIIEKIEETKNIFENFAYSNDFDNILLNLKSNIDFIRNKIENIISNIKLKNSYTNFNDNSNTDSKSSQRKILTPKKMDELLNILNGVDENILRIKNIISNPDYKENLKLNNIVFSSLVQIINQYPNVLYGDMINKNQSLSGSKINLEVCIEDNLKLFSCGYQMQLMFYNLLSNAIEAIKNSGNISISATRKKDGVQIIFSNSPSIISKEELNNIKSKKLFSTKSNSRGKGLKIIFDVINNNDASVYIDYAEDEKKLSFIMFFPGTKSKD